MVQIVRTNPKVPDFIELEKQLDKELAITDGEDHAFYDQFNKTDNIKYAVLFYDNEVPVGCGALKEFEPGVVEIKRMYTKREARGKGFGLQTLNELENWAAELGYKKCILETGINQPQAIALYKKNGYQRISNYGQYAGVEKSFCFGKSLTKSL